MTASTPSEPVFTAPSDVDLSGARQSFDETGFAVIENFADKTECQSLMDEADKLIRDFEPDPHATVFSTSQQQHAKDNYFRSSGDKVRFFLEEEAVDENGNLTCGKFQAVNKIGHALHDLNPVFDQFSRQNRYRRLAETLEIDKPLLLQSMFIFKHAGIGGEVNCHQDSTFLYTEPLSVVGFWLALEDAHKDNGCLWALPGQHKLGLRQRFRYRNGDLALEILEPTPFDQSKAVPLEVSAGSLIALHGCLPHFSGANRSPTSRQAYVVHIIDGTCHYADDNWLQRADTMPLRGY